MALQDSVDVRNAMLESWETILGASPVLEIRSGAQPANCAAGDSGTLLASISLPADAFADAASGVKAKQGTWTDASADGTGAAAHFRLKTSGGVCKTQGSVTITGGGGDLTVDNTSFQAGQAFTVTSFSRTRGNA